MIYYGFDDFNEDVRKLARAIRDDFAPDALLAVARGGLTLAHCLANALEIRELFSLNSIHYEGTRKLDEVKIFNIPELSAHHKILLIDDIVDTGESLEAIKKTLLARYPQLDLKIATIFYKNSALFIPDFRCREAREWVEFFWDISLG